MSNDSSPEEGSLLFHLDQWGNNEGNASGQQSQDTTSVRRGVPIFQTYRMRKSERDRSLRVWLSLLIVLCLGSLGSLSLAPSTLPTIMISTTMAQAKGSVPSPISGPFKESECTAKPGDIKYISISLANGKDIKLPPVWFQVGRHQSDLAYAKACAASFVAAYQTFNASNFKTFDTCTPFLTDGAKQRFYGTGSHMQPDTHANPMWRASMQQQNVQQVAQPGATTLLDVQYAHGRLLAWMLQPYRRSIWINGNQQVDDAAQMTILLIGVPTNQQGRGWQVSEWRDDNVLFDPPDLL